MISVIIPTADRPGPLHRALRSLARQTYRDFEVIVVRDGGRSPQAVVDSWRAELTVRLLEVEPRAGVSHARNIGLTAAAGEYVAFLDDDDIYLPLHLEVAQRALAAGHADVVYGGALVSSRWIEAIPRSVEGFPRKDYPFDDGFLAVANYIHTGSIVCRNFAASPVRFEEGMAHCEDWDMWLALRHTLGYRFAFLGACTSVYHQVPHRSGAVSAAYLCAPTPFTLARAHLYGKWDAPDALAAGYRDWFRLFDARLDACITSGAPVPAHVYEHAVRLLHSHFVAGAPADSAWLDVLFTARPLQNSESRTTTLTPSGMSRRPRQAAHAAG